MDAAILQQVIALRRPWLDDVMVLASALGAGGFLWIVMGTIAEGNYEGEAANSPGAPSLLGDYPELLDETRNFPMGRLDDFQRHKVRVWSTYLLHIGRFGSLDISPQWRYNSALTYSLGPADEVAAARLSQPQL